MTATDEGDEVDRLRKGDAATFRELVARYHGGMVRLAESYVPSRAVAEEVVQDTWIAVIRGLDGFERRSSLKTWVFRILVNQARTRGQRERRSVPFSSLTDELRDEPSVAPERFAGRPGHGRWSAPPAPWDDEPGGALLSGATLALVGQTVQMLPANQRRVLLLRDIEGWTSQEVCDAMEISEVNQRVLLHRARSRLRTALEEHLGGQP